MAVVHANNNVAAAIPHEGVAIEIIIQPLPDLVQCRATIRLIVIALVVDDRYLVVHITDQYGLTVWINVIAIPNDVSEVKPREAAIRVGSESQ